MAEPPPHLESRDGGEERGLHELPLGFRHVAVRSLPPSAVKVELRPALTAPWQPSIPARTVPNSPMSQCEWEQYMYLEKLKWGTS